MKNDIRRHAARTGNLEAHRPQPFEQAAIHTLPRVDLDPRPRRAAALDPALPREHEVRGRARILHRRHPLGRELQDRILILGLLQQPVRDELIDIAADLVHTGITQQAERAQVAVAPRRDLFGRVATEDRRHVRRAKALADPRHAGQDLSREQHRIPNRLQLAQTVVACLTSVSIVRLAEIRHDATVPAADGGGVAFHVAHQRPPFGAELAVPLEHDPPLQKVCCRRDQDALRFEAVASGPPGLLLIVLERLRRAGMQDESHVGSIDPHPERDGRNDDVGLLVEEGILILVALGIAQAGVVRHRAVAFIDQPRRKIVHLTSRQAVNDPGLLLMPREHVENLPPQVRARQDPIHEVRPIERPDHLQRVLQAELRDDIAADASGRGGGERVEAGRRQRLAEARQLAVLRSEVVSPLTDAVRFVDRDETDRGARAAPDRAVARVADKTLRREIQQAVARFGESRPHRRLLIGAHRAVVTGGRHPVADEGVHLILHERDQRRHDNRQTVADQGRNLETQRLAAAGRQHEQRIAAGDHGFDGFTLERTK